MAPSSDPSRSDRRKAAYEHIDRSLLVKLRLYLVVFVVVAAIAVVDTVRGDGWSWLFLVGGLVGGVVVGVVASRMQRLDWNEFELRVVGRFDVVGVVVLVLYIVFALNRSRIVEAWVPASYAPATSLAVLAGVMLGQVVGIRRGILILRDRLVASAEEPQAP